MSKLSTTFLGALIQHFIALISLYLVIPSTLGQNTNLPPLAQTKIKAESGNLDAQLALASHYVGQQD